MERDSERCKGSGGSSTTGVGTMGARRKARNSERVELVAPSLE